MNTIRYGIFAIFLMVATFSCQKEISFEDLTEKAQGSLKNDVNGDCLPKTVGGTFIAGKTLTDSNFIQVDIDISSAGSYKIKTDTINGYFFEAIGFFPSAGINTVKLKGKGKPLSAEANAFIITFDSAFCIVPVSVLPAGAARPAVFTLKGSPGSCSNAAIDGNYGKGTALNSSNKVHVEVNVDTIGTYTMSTPVSNGMTFVASGTFGITGAQTVTLVGTGTPADTGSTIIPITVGTSSCRFTIPVTTSADGSLAGSPGVCMNTSVDGAYTQGTALTLSNTATIEVNVTTSGVYSIATNTVNGIRFSQSGNFTTTGLQTIVLDGTGTPSSSGTASFTLRFGNSSCTFPVTISAGAPPPPTGEYFWKFTEGGFIYKGNLTVSDAKMVLTEVPILGTVSALTISGATATGDTLIYLSLIDFGGGIKNNETYSSSASSTNNASFQVHNKMGDPLYTADYTTTGVTLILKVTNHNPTTKVIDVTFSGTAKNGSGVTKTITSGQYKANYQ